VEQRLAARELAKAIQSQLEGVVRGQDETLQCLLVAIIAGGHVLLEGVPGLAKTLLARCLGAALQCQFSRIQFTPDLMPGDITGVSVYNARTQEFELRRGPIFADLVLADEINRAPAKTQSALLEAMQECQVSMDGVTHSLSTIFTVVATQNPIENEGTYPLPEAQLDRFLLKVVMGYPEQVDERKMLQAMHELKQHSLMPAQMIEPVASLDQLRDLRQLAQETQVDGSLIDYILALVRGTRSLPSLALGCSPRSGVMLLHASKALALLRGKDFVSPEEVQAMALPVLRHRVQLTPEAEIEGSRPDDCLKTLLAKVPIPR